MAAESTLDVALRLLAQRDHSEAELARKLSRRGHAPGDIARAVEVVRSHGYLDEPGLAQRRSQRRAEAGYGPQRIRADLAGRGIAREALDAAIGGLDVDWIAKAVEQLRRRYGEDLPADAAERARRAGFLARRGFDAGTIQRALRYRGDDEG